MTNYNKKFVVRVYNKDHSECKEKLCSTVTEVCEILGIKRNTYILFQQGRLKMNTPKTEFLKHVEIKRLKKEDIPKPEPKNYSNYDADKMLEDVFNRK